MIWPTIAVSRMQLLVSTQPDGSARCGSRIRSVGELRFDGTVFAVHNALGEFAPVGVLASAPFTVLPRFILRVERSNTIVTAHLAQMPFSIRVSMHQVVNRARTFFCPIHGRFSSTATCLKRAPGLAPWAAESDSAVGTVALVLHATVGLIALPLALAALIVV